ncbi:MAG TPA: PspA/IM30 family protein [Bryobacteraceae bacterium]|nr:PspA/IM30 family protein [Bryobacteraceae bacterium]
MALLERVGTLLRANLNDLIDRAEEPEKMVKQVILDMENQLMQVKTQVAITIADLHLLDRKASENLQKRDDWMRKAQLAVTKRQDDLARIAIERSLESRKLAESFDEQIADQKVQVENLKGALSKLEGKLAEARGKSELLLAKQRRARAAGNAAEAQLKAGDGLSSTTWDRMKHKVNRDEALNDARAELLGDNLEDRFAALEKQDEVERLLESLKTRKELT